MTEIAQAGIGGFLGRGVPVTGSRKSTIQSPISITPPKHRQRGEHDQRDGHHLRRLVRVDVLGPALLGEEGHQHQPGHVEAGDAGAEHGEHADQPVLGRARPR